MRALILAAAVLSIVGYLAWGAVLDLGFYGWDTFPLIAAGRVESLGGLVAGLGEELMEGRFEGGQYWRPLVHVSFAIDHALWGLMPAGYHATDLALLVAGSLATFMLARKLIGPGVGAWLGALVFLLHPVHFDVLPLPPRRADALAVVFTVAALAVQVGGRLDVRSTGRSLAVGALCLAALGSKETGVLAPAMIVQLAWLDSTPGQRLRATLRASWPALAALAVWAIGHTAVLGGLGGSSRGSLLGGVTGSAEVTMRYATLVLGPAPVLLALGLFAGVLLVSSSEPPRERRSAGALAVHLIVWLSLLVLITGAGGGLRAWYALGFVPPVALALGLLADRGLARGKSLVGGAALTICLALVAVQWSVRFGVDGWAGPRASVAEVEDLCERFVATVDRQPAGARVELVGRSARRIVLPPYALEAYAELVIPDRVVRVEVDRPDVAPPGPHEVLVVLTEN